MGKEMANYSAKKLADHMETIANMYEMSIFYGKLEPEHTWECGCLIATPYKLRGSYYKSTGVFFAEYLVAIVAENGVMYEYVNMLDECDEIKAEISADLDDFIRTGYDIHPGAIIRYPKIDE